MTMIKFLTDGVLIREMMEDPLLTKYRYAHKIEAQIVYLSLSSLLLNHV